MNPGPLVAAALELGGCIGGEGLSAQIRSMEAPIPGGRNSSGTILCPPYPGDPPWRPMTCFILTRLGTMPDRPPAESR